MSERERWIVYPLLFLALGASLRDKLVDRTTSKSIACQELLIVDEQPLGREPVLLARLGGMPRVKAEDPYNGQFVMNGQILLDGQIEVVDRNLNPRLNPLVRIGPAKFGPQGVVAGQVLVNGAINATFYAYQGHPLVPVLRGVFPGASLPAELFRANPDTLTPQQPANPPSAPPVELSPAPQSSTAPPDPNTGIQPSPKPPVAESPGAVPLADPAENR
jgi:hypothetical protein